MKVKVLTNVRYKNESHKAGQVIEIDKKDVDSLEDSNVIEILEVKKESKAK